MDKNNVSVSVVCFSPTRTSKKIAEAIAKGISSENFDVIDLTTDTDADIIEVSSDWVVLASPVYAGRVPVEAAERFKRIKFTKKESTPIKAIVAVVYGNRDYDDALLELKNIAEGLNLVTVAAGAFIGEHSFSRALMPIGEGRPDRKDLETATEFGKKTLHVAAQSLGKELAVKGNIPYCAPMEIPPVSPESTESCNQCGKCIHVCPVHAIRLVDNMIVTDAESCTLCCACVKMCPNEARIFNTPFTKILFDNCKVRKEPELFYAKD